MYSLCILLAICAPSEKSFRFESFTTILAFNILYFIVAFIILGEISLNFISVEFQKKYNTKD